MCLLRLFNRVKWVLGCTIESGMFGSFGLVLILINCLFCRYGVIIMLLRIWCISILLGLWIEVRLYVLFYLCSIFM